jgi:hypothetical protein
MRFKIKSWNVNIIYCGQRDQTGIGRLRNTQEEDDYVDNISKAALPGKDRGTYVSHCKSDNINIDLK